MIFRDSVLAERLAELEKQHEVLTNTVKAVEGMIMAYRELPGLASKPAPATVVPFPTPAPPVGVGPNDPDTCQASPEVS